jgi:hypothetical protein
MTSIPTTAILAEEVPTKATVLQTEFIKRKTPDLDPGEDHVHDSGSEVETIDLLADTVIVRNHDDDITDDEESEAGSEDSGSDEESQ